MLFRMLIVFFVFDFFSMHSFAGISLGENSRETFIYQNHKGHVQQFILDGYTLPQNFRTYLKRNSVTAPVLYPTETNKRLRKNIKIDKDFKLTKFEIISVHYIEWSNLLPTSFIPKAFIIETTRGTFLKICYRQKVIDCSIKSVKQWGNRINHFAWVTLRIDSESDSILWNKKAKELKILFPESLEQQLYCDEINLHFTYKTIESKIF
ncbi:hypothetical protein [Candidatus Sororendozoicomonas aggregata]|uniref:hypothetical protein n=1 Tax=Candidatus Sororendozoicomonas aggregata TaxID=3073239 RepID=UPI002ED0475A